MLAFGRSPGDRQPVPEKGREGARMSKGCVSHLLRGEAYELGDSLGGKGGGGRQGAEGKTTPRFQT